MDYAVILGAEFSLQPDRVVRVMELLDAGNTIPFIARYRKEQTGSLNDQLLRSLADRLDYLRRLNKRKEEIVSSLTEQDALTPALAQALDAAATLAEAEDLYRPFKPKRRTRATMAQERGLAPLAEILLRQNEKEASPARLAKAYVGIHPEVPDEESVLAGARDILAERMAEDAALRKRLRALCHSAGRIVSTKATEEDSVYRQYYDFSAPVKALASHQTLAINRGEKEDKLKVRLVLEETKALPLVKQAFLIPGSTTTAQVALACEDGYQRLLFPSLEREIRAELTEQAQEQSIQLFSLNLRQLLLQPPVKGKRCLAVDPAFRTGCKIAVCDENGEVLETGVIYPTPPQNKTEDAFQTVSRLIRRYHVTLIAVGNGTASREAEQFVCDAIARLEQHDLAYAMVNEAGASVYSASKLGACEFPQLDVSVRSAISLARRLQDPLSELVKIDPQSIGVGQYQHDMPQARLKQSLAGVVEDCVNQVGVDLNTASAPLLSYVAGLSPSVAQNIVAFRRENGAFSHRAQLKKVPKLGPRAFEQCAGFLRIPGGKQLLDNTGVHPESYDCAQQLLTLCGYTLEDAALGALAELRQRMAQLGEEELCRRLHVGAPTLRDIVEELLRPGRDIRDTLPPVLLRRDVLDIKDLAPGMELTGTVRNITDFGIFVDIGVHQDGLVHLSQMSDAYIRHPSQAARVGDVVSVWILSVDVSKKRISLTMKKPV